MLEVQAHKMAQGLVVSLDVMLELYEQKHSLIFDTGTQYLLGIASWSAIHEFTRPHIHTHIHTPMHIIHNCACQAEKQA